MIAISKIISQIKQQNVPKIRTLNKSVVTHRIKSKSLISRERAIDANVCSK